MAKLNWFWKLSDDGRFAFPWDGASRVDAPSAVFIAGIDVRVTRNGQGWEGTITSTAPATKGEVRARASASTWEEAARQIQDRWEQMRAMI
jgi:hypothetical protein